MKIVLSANSSWNLYNFRLNIIIRLLKNHEVILLAPKDNYTEKLVKLGCKYYNIKIDTHGVSIIKDIFLIINYFNKLKKINPHFYISYTIKPNIYGSLIANLLSIKVINNITGLGTVFIKKGFILYISKFLYKLALKNSFRIYFHNNFDLKIFLKMKLVSAKQAEVLPGSGVDLSFFKYKKLKNKENNQLVFLFIGRYIKEKGINEFVRAASTVKQKYPKIIFETVGYFDKHNKSSVEIEFLNKYSNNNIIKILEPSDDIRRYIEESDCIVVPSYREGMPKSLLESSAIGRPMITTDVPGCNELVIDGYNGHICLPRNSKSLSETIVKHIKLSYQKRYSISQNAFDKVKRHYNEKIVINKLISILEKN